MELDVTDFVKQEAMWDFAHSAAEGGQTAGDDTWQAALEVSPDYMFVTDANRDEIESWARDFGAWEEDEIAAWSDIELNALLLQFIAGDMREAEDYGGVHTVEYREAVEAGRCFGRLHGGDDGHTYMYIGH